MSAVYPEFKNPFRPGAGHMPPHLAGRENERNEFERLLDQEVILENLILTGLRGVGKTVLLETFKPIAQQSQWLWAGTDLSEAATISEQALATRLLADLAPITSSFSYEVPRDASLFNPSPQTEFALDFENLAERFDATPGLVSDKLKATLEFVWANISNSKRGIIFAYDEAQNLTDHSVKDQYPLSVLLEVFQSIQRKNVRFMLVLTGLPTLFPKLVEARTYSERMFRVRFLDRLDRPASEDAITTPINVAKCPVKFSDESVDLICEVSEGYPYFIQYICKEIYDLFIQQTESGKEPSVPIVGIIRKLDTDFFAGRWARATDRQTQLLWVIAQLENCDSEFTVQEIVARSKEVVGVKRFGSSHVNQMLVTLTDAGLVYKNRHGRYSFAVPLLGEFIRRQTKPV